MFFTGRGAMLACVLMLWAARGPMFASRLMFFARPWGMLRPGAKLFPASINVSWVAVACSCPVTNLADGHRLKTSTKTQRTTIFGTNHGKPSALTLGRNLLVGKKI